MKNKNGIKVLVACIAIMIGVVGCGKKDDSQNSTSSAENLILSKIGASCSQPGNEIQIFFRDTVIPNGSKIMSSQVCDMMNDMNAKEIATVKKYTNEWLNGEDGICKLIAEKAYAQWGYERALEITQIGLTASQGQSNEHNSRMVYNAVRICHSDETKEKYYKESYSGRTFGIFSVGTIINPTTKKTCPAYLAEMTVQSNRQGVSTVMYPLRALNCDGLDLTAYEKPVDMKGNTYIETLKYSGTLPEYYINFEGDRVPFFKPGSQNNIATGVVPEQASPIPLPQEQVKTTTAESPNKEAPYITEAIIKFYACKKCDTTKNRKQSTYEGRIDKSLTKEGVYRYYLDTIQPAEIIIIGDRLPKQLADIGRTKIKLTGTLLSFCTPEEEIDPKRENICWAFELSEPFDIIKLE
ncbi:MAG: hypothetical protein KKD65_12805 [Gammaproteobacteria bacterium]|nr:hypothetical protein [Gammaproteobacteria bacterium]